MLLTAVAVASGVTISCSDPGGIGLYNPGWDAAFQDAAQKKDAAPTFDDASADATDEAATDASDDAAGDTTDAAPD